MFICLLLSFYFFFLSFFLHTTSGIAYELLVPLRWMWRSHAYRLGRNNATPVLHRLPFSAKRCHVIFTTWGCKNERTWIYIAEPRLVKSTTVIRVRYLPPNGGMLHVLAPPSMVPKLWFIDPLSVPALGCIKTHCAPLDNPFLSHSHGWSPVLWSLWIYRWSAQSGCLVCLVPSLSPVCAGSAGILSDHVILRRIFGPSPPPNTYKQTSK